MGIAKPKETAVSAPSIEPISVRVPDAARMTGISRSKLYQLIASGDIEASKVGRATVVLVSSLRSFLQATRKQPRSK